MNGPRLLGYMLMAVVALFWALSAILIKVVLSAGVSPFHLVAVRTVFAFFLLCLLVAIGRPSLLTVTIKDLPYFATYGAVGLVMMNLAGAWSVKLNPVSVAVLLLYTSPLFILGWAACSRKASVQSHEIITALVVLLGTGLVARAYDPVGLAFHWLGLVVGLIAAAVFAFSSIWGKRGVTRFHPWTVSVYGLGFASAFWILTPAPWRFAAANHPLWIWGGMAGVAILASVSATGLFLLALRTISSAEANLTASLEPVFTMGLAYTLLSERFEMLQLIGAGLLIGGVTYLQVSGLRATGRTRLATGSATAGRPAPVDTRRTPGPTS